MKKDICKVVSERVKPPHGKVHHIRNHLNRAVVIREGVIKVQRKMHPGIIPGHYGGVFYNKELVIPDKLIPEGIGIDCEDY